jgi:hypothetical protein
VSASPRDGRLIVLLAAAHLTLWCVAHEPALRRGWWFLDDYTLNRPLSRGNVAHHLGQGRPGQLAWMLTFYADAGATGDRPAVNVALRVVQGLLHSVAGALIAVVLHRAAERRAVLAAGLPFVLWPMSGEMTLWRAAGEYPLAAALSALGLRLLQGADAWGRRGLAAASLVALAVLTHQLAAGAALVGFGLLVALEATRRVGAEPRRFVRQGTLLLSAYLVGGLASLAIARFNPYGEGSRAVIATSAGDKLAFLGEANRRFFLDPTFSPAWLAALQAALPALGLVAVAWRSRTRPWPAARRLAALTGLLSPCVTPYAAQLAVESNYVSWRIFYLAPWLLGGGFALAMAAPEAPRGLRAAAALALTGVTLSYLPIARGASAVYPRLYAADVALLESIEARGRREAVRRVYVDETWPTTMDPFRLEAGWGGPKLSVMLSGGWAGLLARSPWLVPVVDDDQGSIACRRRCAAETRSGAFRVLTVPEGPTLCVCPP